MLSDAKWGNAYWIDVVRLCGGFIAPDDTLSKVIYFTTAPLSQGKCSRQSAFLNANKTINGDKFEIVRGKYLEKHIICPYCKGDISCPEEKKTDVNISVRMIKDCIHGATDVVVLVSADTDLLPPLELIKAEFTSIKIRVCFPPANYSHEINDMMLSWHLSRPVLMRNNYKRFEHAIMDDEVAVGYTIPAKWKSKQQRA